MPTETPAPEKTRKSQTTQFFLKGLAISLPPVLTLVILIWVANVLNNYIIHPTSTAVRYTLSQFVERSRPTDQFVAWERLPPLEYCDRNYRITPKLKGQLQGQVTASAPVSARLLLSSVEEVYVPFGNEAVPYADYAEVAGRVGPQAIPNSAIGVYMELVTSRYFKSQLGLVAAAVSVAVIVLYFIGGFVTARLGRWVVQVFETKFLGKLPLISNVYSSVKQVTDFFFTERTVEYNRVVSLEYPRRGLWSIGFVTSDSMLEITAAAGEPLVTVLMPTSPMPMTGFTVNVPRSEVIDLNITIDQAFQFCLSCGVLVPSQQEVTAESLQQELAKRFSNTGEVSSVTAQKPTIASTPPTDPKPEDATDGETS
jgi:uncharacterized membrane protein